MPLKLFLAMRIHGCDDGDVFSAVDTDLRELCSVCYNCCGIVQHSGGGGVGVVVVVLHPVQ